MRTELAIHLRGSAISNQSGTAESTNLLKSYGQRFAAKSQPTLRGDGDAIRIAHRNVAQRSQTVSSEKGTLTSA
jgi:hypothetical protein